MLNFNPQFAESAKPEGIAALGINLKSFIFQLVTFVIVLVILKRYVFPKLVATLEDRRKTLEESLVQAKKTEEALARAEEKADDILHKAREQADDALADARNQAKELVSQTEAAAREQADRIIKETDAVIVQERSKLRDEMKAELSSLVAEATEKVLKSKLSVKEDQKLIEQSIKELKI